MGRRRRKIRTAGLLAAPAGGGHGGVRDLVRSIGCHHAITEGLLVLIPSRAPHLFRAALRREMVRPVRILPVGRAALLVEVTDAAEAVDLATWGRQQGLARDVVPGARTVLFDGHDDADRLALTLADWAPGSATVGPETRLAVTYDGPDLAFVAELWGCTEAEVVDRHQGTPFVSAFCGFAPGFAYLEGLAGQERAVPRLATPRTRVPAGSVGLAGTWCGVYPGESPGGWRIIGHTDAVLWDTDRDPPATLAPGTRVRFTAT
jgi:KipI family sensor histidine kinase inhibitor